MKHNSRKNAKHKVTDIPALGYTLRLGSNAVKLPKKFDEVNAHINSLRNELAATKHELAAANKQLGEALNTIAEQINELYNRELKTAQQVADLKHQTRTHAISQAPNTVPTSELLADDHDLDNFYIEFENKFRGTEQEIKDRQKVYVPRLRKLGIDFRKTPLLDIGCGRGEMLEVLKEANIEAIGLDLNESMVKRCNERGLKAVQAEALSYLRKQPSGSLGAITGFHIVEHIPFGFLLRLFEECYRVLTPGGVIIFETPNPENLHVGSFSFYYDPSHLHPIVPDVLAFAVENRGFDKAEILRLHPKGDGQENTNRKDPYVREIVARFYGPQDYAVIGYKIKAAKAS